MIDFMPFCRNHLPMRWITLFGLWALIALSSTQEARADLRVCNQTASRVGVAIGYRDQQGWVSEGWYLLKGNSCEVLLKDDLAARYYYIYAQDYDRGGEWAGRTPLCTRDKEFQIRGVEDCLARGFDRTRFFEIDTGEQKNWTIQLGEPERLPIAPKN